MSHGKSVMILVVRDMSTTNNMSFSKTKAASLYIVDITRFVFDLVHGATNARGVNGKELILINL